MSATWHQVRRSGETMDVKPTQLETRDDPKINTNYLSSGLQPCDLARASSSLSASEVPLCLNGQLAFVVAKIASYICSIRTYSNVSRPHAVPLTPASSQAQCS